LLKINSHWVHRTNQNLSSLAEWWKWRGMCRMCCRKNRQFICW